MQHCEHDLITHCTRTQITPQRLQVIRELMTQQIDLPYLVRLLEHNRVTSLFAYNLNRFSLSPIEASFNEYCARRLMNIAGFNLRLKMELYSVLQVLQERGVRAVPFKGPTLAESIYGNIALRQFGDLDILIDQQKFATTKDILIELGYNLVESATPFRPAEFQRRQVDATFVHAGKGSVIELHWKLISPFWSHSKIPSDVWAYVVPRTSGASQIEVFQDEFLYVYLCFHGYKHSWERLSWLVDVAELTNNRPWLDWKKIAALADQFAISDIVDAGTLLAKNILDASVPADVEQRLLSERRLVRLVPFVKRI